MTRARKVWHAGAGLALSAGSAVAVAASVASSFSGAACAPVAPEPAAAQPFNACPEHSCDRYVEPGALSATCSCIAFAHPTTASERSTSCTEPKACITQAKPTVFLKIDVPGDSAFAPGLTFFIMDPAANSATFVKDNPSACVDPNTYLTCVQLPPATPFSGELLATYDVTQTVGFNLGNGPASQTTLPVTATIAPFLSFGTPAALVDARTAGVFVTPPLLSQIAPTSPEYSGNAVGVGPYGGVPIGFYTPLAVGTYAVTLQPGAPFDAYFPPMAMTPKSLPAHADFLPILLTVDPPAARSTSVRSATALDGMVAYLRNAAGVRISTRVPLHGQDATTGIPLQLQTSGQPANLAGDFFVIAPADALDPGGRATFTNTALSITTGGLGAEQTYPQLPAPVTVAGQVLTAGLVPAAAEVYLTSTGIDRVDQSAPDDTSLSYVTSFATDALGNYSVTLPPGTYSARVAPRGAGLTCDRGAGPAPAQTVTTLDVSTTPAAQNGKSLQLADGIPVSGTYRVADGRPLSSATVVLTASTSLASNPGTVPAPRTFSTVTDDSGSFCVPVDPGVYDVTIQPAPGSNLPWVVATRQTVAAPSFALADQVVPAPVTATYSIFEPPPDGLVIPNARVTAYPSPVMGADAGSSAVVVAPVAQGITDAFGNVNLLFAGAAP